MKRSLYLWQFAGFAVSTLLGTVLHYLYDWTEGNTVAAVFSGVNESTWEHMKLLFFPMFLFALIQSRYFGAYKDFWCVTLFGIASGLVSIPVLFYTYNGMFGKSPDWVNILIFFLAAAIAYGLETLFFQNHTVACRYPRLAFAIICLIGAALVLFTFFPPQIPLFLDPVTNTYGIQ